MADQQSVSQLIVQAEYQGPSQQNVSQVLVQAEYQGPPQQNISQFIVQVEYQDLPQPVTGSTHRFMDMPVLISRTAPSAMTFSLTPNTMSSESPLNRSVQTAELPGARWVASFSWQNLTDADARILKAWLAKLSGRAGRFYLHDYTHPTPSGSAHGDPLVKGAGQSGRTLQTDGWTANQASLLLPGDYIGIGSQLCVITETAASDGSGNATLTFEPPLRSAPTDNLPIITTRPTCIMMLTSDEQDKFPFMEKNVTNVQIDCMEAF